MRRRKGSNFLFVVFCIVILFVFLWNNSQNSLVNQMIRRLMIGNETQVETISADKYAYQCLEKEEKQVYDQVLDAILTYKEKIVVSTTEEEVLDKVYQCVFADYGGLFWVEGYQYQIYSNGGRVLGIEFLPKYTMTEAQKEELQVQIDETVIEWLEDLDRNASDYEKSKYVFETIAQRVTYDVNSTNNQNILSVFLQHSTVCQGYANAVAYLLEQVGIPCTIVSGTAGNQLHAWNLVLLDGAYYFMDATWGDGRFQGNVATNKTEMINYGYLNMTSSEISATHVLDMPIPIPECSQVACNYYRQEGKYIDQWNPSKIGLIFQEAWEQKKDMVSIKAANSELYEKIISYYITNHHLSDVCSGIRSIRYIEDRDLYILTLQF